MKNIKKFTAGILLMSLLIVGGITFYFHVMGEKTAYVDTTLLYNEFQMKVEYEAKLTKFQEGNRNFLDSLKMDVDIIARRIGTLGISPRDTTNPLVLSYYQRKYIYQLRTDEFVDQNKKLIEEYKSQILKQINQYVQDYGSENKYTFLYGASGNGTLMYASDSKNISKEVIDYINSRYSGN